LFSPAELTQLDANLIYLRRYYNPKFHIHQFQVLFNISDVEERIFPLSAIFALISSNEMVRLTLTPLYHGPHPFSLIHAFSLVLYCLSET
jgi:hypothetical protein